MLNAISIKTFARMLPTLSNALMKLTLIAISLLPCVLSAQQQKEREPYRNKAEEEGVNWTPGIKLKHSNDFSLVDAAEKGNLAKVKEQIKSGSSPDSCLVSAHGGETALIAAVKKGHIDIASYLLANGANPNGEDVNRETALHNACINGNIDVINLLLLKGANVNYPSNVTDHFKMHHL